MALPDLTGQNIENTYQRLVQVSGSSYYNGTGSLLDLGGGAQDLQSVLDQGSSTSTTITSSAETAISASGTGSFGHGKATNIEGNSPLNIKGVSSLTFSTASVEFGTNANLYGNPIFHGDVNVYSGSAFLDEIDAVIFRSTNDSIPANGFLQLGDNSTPMELHANGIKTTSALTASIISASSAITASNLSGNNTGDQDLSSYIQNSQTSSFVQNSQTSSMTVATASFINTINGGTF